ncbi:MAG: hypothetical protein QM751_06170 [Paludibacteraceae bacterium]
MEQERFVRVPFVSIAATSITQYFRTFDIKTNKFLPPKITLENGDEQEVKPPKFDAHKGILSEKAKRQLVRSVNNLLLSVDENILLDGRGKENVSFITLTLPSSQILSYSTSLIKFYHTDQEIKSKCLNQFLIEIKEKGVKNFVWVAEKQLNANIHFHILVDKNLDKDFVRTSWNRIINKLGYVDRYSQKMSELSFSEICQLRKKERKSELQLKKAFEYGIKTKWMQPNSTDTAPLQNVDNVSAYVAKYVSKGFGHEDKEVKKYIAALSAKYELSEFAIKQLYTIDGRIWQCSQSVSRSRKCVDFLEDSIKMKLIN